MPTNVAPMKKTLRGCRSGCMAASPLQQVEDAEEHDPDDVDEMPVQRRSLDHVVMLRRELASLAAIEDDAEHEDPAEDVGAVEAGEGEVRRPERAGVEGQPVVEKEGVVVRLKEEEDDAEDERGRDVPDERPPVVAADRPDRELAGDGAGDEDERGDEDEPD